MGSISRMAMMCIGCPKVGTCNHKRMEALAYLEQPNISMNAGQQIAESLAMPLMRETMKINDGHGNMVMVYKDDIQKQISEQLFKDRFNMMFGA